MVYFSGIKTHTMTTDTEISRPLELNEAMRFMFAGKATITVKSLVTANHLTFKIVCPPDKDKDNSLLFWVSIMIGTDNETHYAFIGSVFFSNRGPRFKYSMKASLPEDSLGVKSFKWLLDRLVEQHKNLRQAIEIWHAGHCCRCGKKLTTPESIERGIGPKCFEVIGGETKIKVPNAVEGWLRTVNFNF